MGDEQEQVSEGEYAAAREAFIGALAAGHRVLGIGGSGDGPAFEAAGISYVALEDAGPGTESRGAGVVRELPFAPQSFDAAWAMDVLTGISNTDLYSVLTEIMHVLKPGAPLAAGLPAGADTEGPDPATGSFRSLRSDEMLRNLFEQHGFIRSFATWPLSGGGHYQFLVVTKP